MGGESKWEPNFLNNREVPKWVRISHIRKRARELLINGATLREMVKRLNTEFDLDIKENTLRGFIHANKGGLKGPAWFIDFLSESAPKETLATLTDAGPTAGSIAAHRITSAASFVLGESGEEEIEQRQIIPPGNGPLRLKKSSAANGAPRNRRERSGGIGRFTEEDMEGFSLESVFDDFGEDDDVSEKSAPRKKMTPEQIKAEASRFLAFRASQQKKE